MPNQILFYLIYAAVVVILIFFPEIMPRCSHCKKIKFRFRFKLHKCISLSLTYKGNMSICKKCFFVEDITSFEKLKHLQDTNKRVKYKTKFMIK